MTNTLYDHIRRSKSLGKKLFAVLIDPDKTNLDLLPKLLTQANKNKVDFFFIGGSLVLNNAVGKVIDLIKMNSDIPTVLFPGDINQLNDQADALLLLSLISGRNAELLIGKHVVSAPFLKNSDLEIIPTGYMLIDGGVPTSVSYMSNTTPIPANKTDIASCTAIAGEILGLQLIYMDAGSGAANTISKKMIRDVSKVIDIPLIIGGGIKTPEKMDDAFSMGANVVVIGNAFENKPELIKDFRKIVEKYNTKSMK